MSAIAAPPARPEGARSRGETALWLAVFASIGLVLAAALAGKGIPVLGLLLAPLILGTYWRTLLAWQSMFAFTLAIILFIPIRRYSIGGGLPFELEPYRVVIALVLGCWFLALMVDPKIRIRRTGFDVPVIMFLTAILLSLALNLGRVSSMGEIILKQVTFFATFFLVLYLIASTIHTRRQVDTMLRVLVGGGTIVALLALFEWKSGTNVFNSLGFVLPFLHYMDQGEAMVRGTGVRAMASAQHPIALGAALVMLLPIAVYLFKRDGRKLWLASVALLTLGALSTGSRTAAVMLIVLLVVFFWLKRDEMIRMIPTLLALMCVIQVVMPGTLGTFKAILNPKYMIAEQSVEMGTGSGRIADLGPSLNEWSRSPWAGQGFGTRVPTKEGQEGGSQILDNQWLGTLMETGALGFIGLLWTFVRSVRRLARRAREKEGADSWLATTLAASLSAIAVGMFTFDCFAFIQVTFFAFVMLGFAAVLTRDLKDPPLIPRRSAHRARSRAPLAPRAGAPAG